MGNDNSGVSVLFNQAVGTMTSTLHRAQKVAQMATKTQMEKDDDALYELWDGVAGDNFRLASYVCEQNLLSIATFNHNASEALAETGANFDYVDEELAKNIEVEVEEDG